MGLFHIIEDVHAVLRCRGVYRQTKVFYREDKVYAGWGSGFIRLFPHGGTTVPSVSWDHLDDHTKICCTHARLEYVQ